MLGFVFGEGWEGVGWYNDGGLEYRDCGGGGIVDDIVGIGNVIEAT